MLRPDNNEVSDDEDVQDDGVHVLGDHVQLLLQAFEGNMHVLADYVQLVGYDLVAALHAALGCDHAAAGVEGAGLGTVQFLAGYVLS